MPHIVIFRRRTTSVQSATAYAVSIYVERENIWRSIRRVYQVCHKQTQEASTA